MKTATQIKSDWLINWLINLLPLSLPLTDLVFALAVSSAIGSDADCPWDASAAVSCSAEWLW